jgi:hypothetical protein
MFGMFVAVSLAAAHLSHAAFGVWLTLTTAFTMLDS